MLQDPCNKTGWINPAAYSLGRAGRWLWSRELGWKRGRERADKSNAWPVQVVVEKKSFLRVVNWMRGRARWHKITEKPLCRWRRWLCNYMQRLMQFCHHCKFILLWRGLVSRIVLERQTRNRGFGLHRDPSNGCWAFELVLLLNTSQPRSRPCIHVNRSALYIVSTHRGASSPRYRRHVSLSYITWKNRLFQLKYSQK